MPGRSLTLAVLWPPFFFVPMEKLRVLIACECSGQVRSAVESLGHFAMSCDLKPSKSPGHHYQGDIFDVIDDDWDLMIGFPPCTFLAKVQIWRYGKEPGRAEKRDDAVDFVRRLMSSKIEHIALENPSGFLSYGLRPSNQLVRPWWFGDPYDKEINLWTKNLPPLMATCYSPFRKSLRNHVNGRMSQDLKSEIKSSWKYFPGMSRALADQFCNYVTKSQCI